MLFRLCLCIALLSSVVSAPHSSAQPLADHVPDTAWAYIGWAGTDALADDYDASQLKQVVELFQTQAIAQAWQQVKQRAMSEMEQELDAPQTQAVLNAANTLGQISLANPTALYFTPPAQGWEHGDTPTIAALWSPTDDASRETLVTALRTLEDAASGEITVGGTPQIVWACIGEAPVPANPLTAVPHFAAATQTLGRDRPLVAYANLPAMVALLHQTLIAQASPEDPVNVPAMLDTLGLAGLGPALITGGFEADQWRTDILLSAPAPRQGLLSLLDTPALDDNALSSIPQQATWATAVSFDLGTLIDVIRHTATAAGPNAEQGLAQGLAMANGMLGVDLEQQLLRGLGTTWIAYTDPAIAGPGYASLTLSNTLTDPQGVAQVLETLHPIANMIIAQQLSDQDMLIQIHTQEIQGIKLHSVPLMLAAPSWAVIGDRLVLGLYPQTVVASIDQAADNTTGSLSDSEAFAPFKQRTAGLHLTSLSYIDLPRTAPSAYPLLLSLEHFGTSMASWMSGQPMPMILPPLNRLMPLLEPMSSHSWVDAQGWHHAHISPFPGAAFLSPQGASQMAIAPTVTTVGVLLPALGAARRTARQMADSTQARGIHQSMIVMAQSTEPGPNGNRLLTDDISDLTESNSFTPDYALSAASGKSVPWDYAQWPEKERRNWVRLNADYILVPGLEEDLDPQVIALFLRPNIYNEPGDIIRGTITYNDNSTSFEVGWEEIQDNLIRQTGMNIDQLIARQEALAE